MFQKHDTFQIIGTTNFAGANKKPAASAAGLGLR